MNRCHDTRAGARYAIPGGESCPRRPIPAVDTAPTGNRSAGRSLAVRQVVPGEGGPKSKIGGHSWVWTCQERGSGNRTLAKQATISSTPAGSGGTVDVPVAITGQLRWDLLHFSLARATGLRKQATISSTPAGSGGHSGRSSSNYEAAPLGFTTFLAGSGGPDSASRQRRRPLRQDRAGTAYVPAAIRGSPVGICYISRLCGNPHRPVSTANRNYRLNPWRGRPSERRNDCVMPRR
jgi:hypothetical protein